VRGYPLIVTVALAEDEIFATYKNNKLNYCLLATGLTLLIFGVIGLGIRHHARLKRARAAIHASKMEAQKKSRELEVTLDHMQHGIMMVDADGNIAVLNKRVVELLELPDELSQGRPKHSEVIDYLRWRGEFGEQTLVEETSSSEVMKNIVDTSRYQVFERKRPNGNTLKITCVPLAEGGFVRVFADITERKRDEAQVAYMVRHDMLTGLANRVLLHERMSEAAAQLRRHQTPFAVLGIDLDRFKAVNDTLGHPIGDKLLQQVAKRLQAAVRDIDTVARFGGDEFTVLVANQGRREDVNQLAARLVEKISAPYTIDGNKLNVGASIGIATAPEDGIDPDVLLKNADIALYRAKADGGESFQYFAPEMDAHMQSRRLVEIELRNAVANNEFVLHYQPVMDISNNRIVGAEALIRWNHPTRGLVYPGDFIAVAEETGLIGPMGDWVLHAACQEAAQWAPHTKIAVNVSAVQFNRPDLIGVIAQALELSGLPPHRLELEITESVLLQGDDDHLATLELLSQLGIRIALDDFGTGYSSFSYLRKFKFDTIKIDRTFVSELPDCADCSAIISAIAGLARTMGVLTTAEGVENKDQLEWLKLAGCTHVQGFLFSKAVPPLEFRQSLEASMKRREKAA
jgi:diguanylate cyclase (GGDEF)-like protein